MARRLARHRAITSNRKISRRLPLSSLTDSQNAVYRRVLDAIGLMRRHRRYSLARAADETGTSPATVRRYAGPALTKRHGRYRTLDSDRLRRELYLYDRHGKFSVVTRSSKAASRIAEYHNAVRSFIAYADSTALAKFEGKTLKVDGQDYVFLTDRRALTRLARAGELHFLDIYAHGNTR